MLINFGVLFPLLFVYRVSVDLISSFPWMSRCLHSLGTQSSLKGFPPTGSVNLAGLLAPAGDLSCTSSWLRKRALAWAGGEQWLPWTEGYQGLLKWWTAKPQLSVPPLHVLWHTMAHILSPFWACSLSPCGASATSSHRNLFAAPWPSPWNLSVCLLQFFPRRLTSVLWCHWPEEDMAHFLWPPMLLILCCWGFLTPTPDAHMHGSI